MIEIKSYIDINGPNLPCISGYEFPIEGQPYNSALDFYKRNVITDMLEERGETIQDEIIFLCDGFGKWYAQIGEIKITSLEYKKYIIKHRIGVFYS